MGVKVGDAYLGKNPLSFVSIWDGQNFTLSEKDDARTNYETLSDYQIQPKYLPWNLDGVDDHTMLEPV